MATIHSIVYQPKDQEEYGERLDNFIRFPLEEANLIAGYGIEGDAKAGHNPRRQVNLLSRAWVESMAAQGYRSNPGDFGEQLIIQDLAVNALKPGDHLQLGENAVIEITKARTGCTRLEAAQQIGKRNPDENLAVIGMLAKVVTSGIIRIGESVTVLEEVQTS